MTTSRRRTWRAALVVGAALHFAASLALLSRQVDWDGLGYLMRAAGAGPDYMHLAYPTAVRCAVAGGGVVGLAPETSGAVLSAMGLTALFVLLAGLVRRDDEVAGPLVVALLVTTTPDLWRQGLSVEVYAPSLALLVAGARAARAHRRAPSLHALVGAALGLAGAAAFHGAAVLATPWLVRLAARDRPAGVRIASGLLAAAAFGALVLAAILGADGTSLGLFLDRVAGFLPWRRADLTLVAGTQRNLWNLGRFAVENVPFLSAAAAAGLVATRGAIPRRGLWLVTPFLLAWVALGVPLYGLLLPAVVGLGLAVPAAWRVARWRGVMRGAIALLLVLQVAMGLPARWREARTDDPLHRVATAVARAVPADATILAGRAARHMAFHTNLHVVALPDVLHLRVAREGRDTDLLAFVRDRVAAIAADGRPVYVTSDGLQELLVRGVREADLRDRLPHDPPIRLLDDPPLVLVRLRPDAPAREESPR